MERGLLRILEFEGSDLGKPSPVALASPSFCARPEGSACTQIKGPSVLVITLAHVYLFFTAIGGGHREPRKEAGSVEVGSRKYLLRWRGAVQANKRKSDRGTTYFAPRQGWSTFVSVKPNYDGGRPVTAPRPWSEHMSSKDDEGTGQAKPSLDPVLKVPMLGGFVFLYVS